jgi:LuxR family maltose regulon positive regulatory protein
LNRSGCCFALIFAIAPLLCVSLGDFWSSAIFLLFCGLVLVGFSAAAYFLDCSSLYFYAPLFFTAPIVGEWLYASYRAAHRGFPGLRTEFETGTRRFAGIRTINGHDRYNTCMAVLISTKFHIPPAPAGFVARPHLLQKLEAARACRLTLVSAPAGAGKTTLASAWAQAARREGIGVGWLSLDAGDNDPKRFLAYLEACLEEGGIAIPGKVRPPDGSQTPPADDLLAGFIQWGAALKREVILVLDDFHQIQNPEIHIALEYLLEHLPARLHIVLLTRSDPPLALARLRVSGQLSDVRMEHLRFSTSEAATFLKQAAGVQLVEADVVALNTRTEGWVAGLQMAAISLRGRQDVSAFIAAFTGSHRFVFDYLLEEVLSRQTPEVRQFLLQTSVLERLSAPLCDAVAETNGAARRLLDTLERDNLFLAPLDDERGWYRYHHLFADLLKLVLEQTQSGLTSELHRRACDWYALHELLPEALHHALAAGDVELAARLVSANVLVLIEHDETAPTLQKIDAVPLHTLHALPWLGIARAWVMGVGQVQKSHQILDNVEKSLESIPDAAERWRLQGHLAAARAFVYGAQGDLDNTIHQAQLADGLLPAEEVGVRALNLALWGDILSKDRHDPAAMPILERALELARQAHKPHVALIAAAALTLGHLGAGRFRQAHRVCQEALEIAEAYQQRTQQRLSAAAMNYTLMARVTVEWGETEKAIRLGRTGLALCERWGQDDTEVMCLLYLGQAAMFSGDRCQALQVFQRAQHTAQKISPWLWQMATSFALDSLLDSESPTEDEVQAQIHAVQESGGGYPVPLQARLLLRNGQPDEALAITARTLEDFGGQPSMIIVRLHALRALAYQARGEDKKALVALEEALAQAAAENRVMSLAREGEPMMRLLRLALRRSAHPEFVRRLLAAGEARRKALPAPPPAAGPFVEPLIEPLSERELEVLRSLNGPLSTPEIAERLFVSANTVRTHIKNIYAKLGVHGRSAAVRRGQELGLNG